MTMPLRTDLTNQTQAEEIHPGLHNAANAAINALVERVTSVELEKADTAVTDALAAELETKAALTDLDGYVDTAELDSRLAGLGGIGQLLTYIQRSATPSLAGVTMNSSFRRIPSDNSLPLTFTAPTSGRIIWELSTSFFWDNTSGDLEWALLSGTSGAVTELIAGDNQSLTTVNVPRNGTIMDRRIHLKKSVKCTPGQAYSLHLAAKGSSGTFQVNGSVAEPLFVAVYAG